MGLKKLTLSDFRNYEALRLDTGGAQVVVLTGANGAGKTNILEALSLLVPGRGLRTARLEDITRKGAAPGAGFAVAAEVETIDGQILRLGTGLERATDPAKPPRRRVRVDGKPAARQADLSRHVAAVWLTPQMDRLFLEGGAARRRFLDRLVFAFDPAHAARLARFEKEMRARLRLLTASPRPDPHWLSALESQMAAEAVAVAAARLSLLPQLQHHAADFAARQDHFPGPAFALDGWLETELQSRPALQLEDEYKERLRLSRSEDAAAGRTHHGPHRTDFAVRYAAKDMEAAQCSTGEQKGLLVSTVLAHARMMRAEKGFVPLLLLDEVAAHLDPQRRGALFRELQALDGQVWLTGTDRAIFDDLKEAARFFNITEGFARAA